MFKIKIIRGHFKKVDPVIYKAMAGLDFSEWIKPRKKKRDNLGYFRALCREIIAQQLAGEAADAITKRFKNLFEPLQVEPKKILSLPDQTLRDVGMSWAKVKYLKDLSQKTLNREVNFDLIGSFSDEKVIAELTKVKGIGPWTAEMFLMFTLGRENVFSFGDLGLRRGLEKLYQIQNPTTKQIEKIVNPWSPYKSYGSITLWHSLES